jgi:hypothetical protein
MLYASSKDALRKSLVGISSEIQGTDMSEVAHETGEFLLMERGTPSGVTVELNLSTFHIVLEKVSRTSF